jgi:hypothetical protein
MSNPEVEVRTLKKQGGESLKDAWYRISNAHHRCTKKYSTMILLRNFYVGMPHQPHDLKRCSFALMETMVPKAKEGEMSPRSCASSMHRYR